MATSQAQSAAAGAPAASEEDAAADRSPCVRFFLEADGAPAESLGAVSRPPATFTPVDPGKPTGGKVLEFPDGDRHSRYWCIGLAAACEMAQRRADSRIIYCYEWVPPPRP